MKAFIDKRGLNLSHMQNVIADRSKKNDKATLEGKRKRIAQGSVLLKCAMYQETVSDALQRENTDHSNSEDPLSVLHDASTQADDSGYAVAVPSLNPHNWLQNKLWKLDLYHLFAHISVMGEAGEQT